LEKRMPPSSPDDVLARYGNYYQGSDDLFAHCLILRNGHCVLLLQGLEVVTVRYHRAPPEEFEQLVQLLARAIPAGWLPATYQGYNFITDPEGPAAREIAVYGEQPGDDTRPPGEYYVAPTNSEVADFVKRIAQID
jgi:hypothetical protein